MKETEQKATRLVTDDRVTVDVANIVGGEVIAAAGIVEGDHDVYVVECSPDGDTCTCPFGEARPGVTHSHTRALRLAVWIENREEMQ